MSCLDAHFEDCRAGLSDGKIDSGRLKQAEIKAASAKIASHSDK